MTPSVNTTRRARASRGAILVLVILAVAIATVAGIIFLSTASTATAIAQIVDENAQARQIAESGMAVVIRYVERTPGWRAEKTSGSTWVVDHGMLGGAVSVSGDFASSADSTDVALADPGFEAQVATLPTPLLNPPMSGAIGLWEVERTALVQSGPTVPAVRTAIGADSTEGANQAQVAFGASVTGSGLFRQTLGVPLAPNCRYEMTVDIKRGGLPLFDDSFGFRVSAGSTLVASTTEALSAFDQLTQEEIQARAEQLVSQAAEPATLISTLLSGSFSVYTMTFMTGSNPPPGLIEIELFAESTGIAATIGFDNVRLTVHGNEPLRLTATGRCGKASHAVTALVSTDLGGESRVIQWIEP